MSLTHYSINCRKRISKCPCHTNCGSIYSNSLHLCTTGRMKNGHLLIEKRVDAHDDHWYKRDSLKDHSSSPAGKKKKRYNLRVTGPVKSQKTCLGWLLWGAASRTTQPWLDMNFGLISSLGNPYQKKRTCCVAIVDVPRNWNWTKLEQ